ncbi:Uncharacterised protein [Vibrio cholerae]|nr:Uncharacterised protein [Vibrio cholerae]
MLDHVDQLSTIIHTKLSINENGLFLVTDEG